MLLEVYILFQILAIIGLIMIFHSTTIFVSTVTMVVSGILMVGAWVLDIGLDFIWDPVLKAYETQAIIVNTPYLAIFNIIVFGIALLYFVSDLMDLAKGETQKVKTREEESGAA